MGKVSTIEELVAKLVKSEAFKRAEEAGRHLPKTMYTGEGEKIAARELMQPNLQAARNTGAQLAEEPFLREMAGTSIGQGEDVRKGDISNAKDAALRVLNLLKKEKVHNIPGAKPEQLQSLLPEGTSLDKARETFKNMRTEMNERARRQTPKYAPDVPILPEGTGPWPSNPLLGTNDLPLEAPHMGRADIPIAAPPEQAAKIREWMAKRSTEDVASEEAKQFAKEAYPEAHRRRVQGAVDEGVESTIASPTDLRKAGVEPTTSETREMRRIFEEEDAKKAALDALPTQKILAAGAAAPVLQNPYEVAKKAYEYYNEKLDKAGEAAGSKLLDVTTPQGMPGAKQFKADMLPIVGAGIAGVADPLNYIGGSEAKLSVKATEAAQKAGKLFPNTENAIARIAERSKQMRAQAEIQRLQLGRKSTLSSAEKLAEEQADKLVPLTKP